MPRRTLEFMIVNRRSHKALTVTGEGDGAVVRQQTPTGEDRQVWTKQRMGICVKFINKFTGKALDVVQEGTENGTWAQVWEDVDGASQQWKIIDITATYKKLLNVRAGKVLDIADMSIDDGAPAQLWEDVDGVGQQWKLEQVNKPEHTEKREPKPSPAPKREEKPDPKRPQIPDPAPKPRGRPRKVSA